MKEVHVTNASAVVLQQVTKRFQNVTAVDAIDLDIRDGEFFDAWSFCMWQNHHFAHDCRF
jgi:hypothetical protein